MHEVSEGTLSAQRIWKSAPLVAPMPAHVPDWTISETDEERQRRIEFERWAKLKERRHGQ